MDGEQQQPTPRTMRAKLAVGSISKSTSSPDGKTSSVSLSMHAVAKSGGYPADGSDEDNTYARWSPSASFNIQINNPALFDSFHVGQKFYVDFTEAPDSPAKPA